MSSWIWSDERLEPIRYDDPVDLVAITVETFTARNAYQIAARFRRRKVPVVMGGFHPTMLPEESLAYADAVVVGDAEGLWPEVVRDARCGMLRRVYRSMSATVPCGPSCRTGPSSRASDMHRCIWYSLAVGAVSRAISARSMRSMAQASGAGLLPKW